MQCRHQPQERGRGVKICAGVAGVSVASAPVFCTLIFGVAKLMQKFGEVPGDTNAL
jgi:hypothetical protein